jgi:uncharacterized integral membrane protein
MLKKAVGVFFFGLLSLLLLVTLSAAIGFDLVPLSTHFDRRIAISLGLVILAAGIIGLAIRTFPKKVK